MCSAARHRRRIVQTEWRRHHPSRLSAPIRLGHDGRVPQGSRHPGCRGGPNDRYARTIEIDGVHGVVAVEPASGHALRVVIRFSGCGAADDHCARAARVRSRSRPPGGQRAARGRSVLALLVAARPGPRYQVRGTVRARRSGRARRANHGGRRSRPCREARDALRRGAGRQRPEHRGADPCLSSS